MARAADGPGADLLPVPHAPRTAAARGRREAARRGHRGRRRDRHPLRGRDGVGDARRARRRVPVGRVRRLVQPEHDRGARVHRAGRGDLRQVAPGGRARRHAPVRLLERAGEPPADVLGVHRDALPGAPYVLTLIAVAGVIGRSRAPGSIGIPYVKE